MITHSDEGPDSEPDDPLAVILRPASDYLGPPPGHYETIRRGAARRRLLRTAVGVGSVCAVAALVALPIRLSTSQAPTSPTVPLAPPSEGRPSPVPPSPSASPVPSDPSRTPESRTAGPTPGNGTAIPTQAARTTGRATTRPAVPTPAPSTPSSTPTTPVAQPSIAPSGSSHR
ncbi:hypothetical protein [Streptomyces olivochromogenes]|uniref:Uncharacterized protein n=1 Tax=Streptomyces olivochromogenes TaxID=1963 RepID=A0A250VBX6_STROL|nr:hypothetical protein [Streptomyces olivochromogenes]GAX51546.1 hypothetical protein SO3561_03048 [Streptomyces olivochromogenes]